MQTFSSSLKKLENFEVWNKPTSSHGQICKIVGPILQAKVPHARIGQWAKIKMNSRQELLAEVVSLSENLVGLAPFDETRGVALHAEVELLDSEPRIRIPREPLGKVLNPWGTQIGEEVQSQQHISLPIENCAPNPLSRKKITKQLETGIKGLDCLTPIGEGQRLGLFAGPGVGKSTLIGMLARYSKADVNIIALIGERGREVREFVEDVLGPDGMARSVVVVSTSDESAAKRVLAAKTATCIAEYFRAHGKNVLLLFDSLTRTARALRDLSLAAGELPVRQGYTPTVYATLPKLIERTGNDEHGSITALYTILAQERQEFDPLAEEVKSLLDGHLVLSNKISERGVRPAIDYLNSISRLAYTLLDKDQRQDKEILTKALARLEKDRDIILLGGTPDAELKLYLQAEEAIRDFLKQDINQHISLTESRNHLRKLSAELNKHHTEI